MKLTIEEHMKWLAQYAGGTVDRAVLNKKDTNTLAPLLMAKLQEEADVIGYDGFIGDPIEYPHVIWVMVYNGIVKPTVLEWIDETCPKAWFRMMYLPKEDQDAFMAKQ